MQELVRWLGQSGNWLNPGALIQMSVAIFLVIGLLIALPDRITNNIMKQDRFGGLLVVLGVVIMLIFLAPQVMRWVVDIIGSGSWVVFLIAAVLLIVGLAIRRRRSLTS